MRYVLPFFSIILFLCSCNGNQTQQNQTPEIRPPQGIKEPANPKTNIGNPQKDTAKTEPAHTVEKPAKDSDIPVVLVKQPDNQTALPESPIQKEIAEHIQYYRKYCHTREWGMLGGSKSRSWFEKTIELAKKYPKEMQEAVLNGAPDWEFLMAIAYADGDSNYAFLKKLCTENPSERLIEIISYTKHPDAWPFLFKYVDSENSSLAGAAISGLVRNGRKEVIPALKKWLESGEPSKCLLAVRLSIAVADPMLVPSLENAVTVIEEKDRRFLYRAFALCGSAKYLNELHEIAKDESLYEELKNRMPPDPAYEFNRYNYLQNESLDAIAKLGSVKSLPVLDGLAKDAKDPDIRIKAAQISANIRKANPDK
jgi:hypothetical protein